VRRDTSHLNRVDVLQIGHMGADHGDVGGLISPTAVRNWRQIGTIGFDQKAIKRAHRGCVSDILSSLKGNDSRKTQKGSDIKTSTSLIGTTSKAMKDCLFGNTFGTQNIKSVIPCIARVDDEWKLMLMG
jgi:hypothetical protein